MAAITAKMVKELRDKSGAGMMDCKKALAATDGDMEKAIDFVAKNEKFQNFVKTIADQVMATDAADVEALAATTLPDGQTVQELLVSQIATIGENMKIRRFARVEEANGLVVAYTHMGGKIVVLVDVETDVVNEAVCEMAKNIAMQAAAMRPEYTNRSEVSQEYLDKEREILLVAAKNEKPNAPEKVINGIVMGRLNKELSEICLLDQVYVKAEDGKQTVQKYVDQVAKANGAKIAVKKFVRFETGEGLEKKQENFAAEVAAQMKG